MHTLLQQLKQQRLKLGLKQSDMLLRIGISRQQYQQLEAKGNPRLETLVLLAKGLNSELMLIPHDKLQAVQAILAESSSNEKNTNLADAPWQGLLGDDTE